MGTRALDDILPAMLDQVVNNESHKRLLNILCSALWVNTGADTVKASLTAHRHVCAESRVAEAVHTEVWQFSVMSGDALRSWTTSASQKVRSTPKLITL